MALGKVSLMDILFIPKPNVQLCKIRHVNGTEVMDYIVSLPKVVQSSVYLLKFFDLETNSFLIESSMEEKYFSLFVDLVQGKEKKIHVSSLNKLEELFVTYQCYSLKKQVAEMISNCSDSMQIINSLIFLYERKQSVSHLIKSLNIVFLDPNSTMIPMDLIIYLLSELGDSLSFDAARELSHSFAAKFGASAFIILTHFHIKNLTDEEKMVIIDPFLQFIPFYSRQETQHLPQELQQRQQQFDQHIAKVHCNEPIQQQIELNSKINSSEEQKDSITETKIIENVAKPADYSSDIFDAVQRGSIDNIKYLLFENPKIIERKDKVGDTPLHYAAKYCQLEIMKVLITSGAVVDESNQAGYTALHKAASTVRNDILSLLLTSGANPNAKGMDMWSPLHDAAMLGTVSNVKLLIKYGADVNAKDASGNTPLSVAGDEDIVNILRENGGK